MCVLKSVDISFKTAVTCKHVIFVQQTEMHVFETTQLKCQPVIRA